MIQTIRQEHKPSRRERQTVQVVYRFGQTTVTGRRQIRYQNQYKSSYFTTVIFRLSIPAAVLTTAK